MTNILVLGAGMVGNAIARDLQATKNYNVTIADYNQERLVYLHETFNLETMHLDVTNKNELLRAVTSHDFVIGAVPGFLGYNTLKTVIEAKKPIVDISFSEKNPLDLHDLAIKNNVTAVIDAGVAPGLSNIIAGHEYAIMDHVEAFTCYVGGLPKERVLPFEYKAPFSPIDVIEEYTREVTYKENGKITTKPAMTDLEQLEFPGIGTLEAFNTDGLRTLLHTLNIPNMKEKTLRYPGHTQKIMLLKNLGFLSTQPLTINKTQVKPRDLTVKLLETYWKMNPHEKDLTVMKIHVKGTQNKTPITRTYYLYDEYDEQTHTSSMARTTGYTAASIARLVIQNKLQEHGIIPPEKIGMNTKLFHTILDELQQRNIKITQMSSNS